MRPKETDRIRHVLLPGLLFTGDAASAFAGLSIGYWLRFDILSGFGIAVPNATYYLYLPLLYVGAGLLLASYSYLNLYDARNLLRKYRSLNLIFKGTTFWLFAYLGISLTLRFDPPISRLFVLYAYLSVIALMVVWRNLFYFFVTRPAIFRHLQTRTAVLGRNADAKRLVTEVGAATHHPLRVVGMIALEQHTNEADSTDNISAPVLGNFSELESLLHDHRIDILVAAQLDLPREQIITLTQICERAYVDLKIVPSVFQIFISNLHLQTIGSVPVLGVDELAIGKLFGRVAKRTLDLIGALTGLLLSVPIVAVLALLIKRESAGPVFFRQERIGTNHRNFTMLKLRSMRRDAAQSDELNQSTTPDDPRLLRIGRFIRRWNLDELPQFWNVLIGDMSLVGPRPERPFHVNKLSQAIPHYLPRHLVKPGMTGWAQVNQLRGPGRLETRIQYDIYYIENWSLLFDIQIMLLTFLRWQTPDGAA